ncbi:hypothetical protein CORC01_05225 [Colletotrichum orchidophilum]|uniref:Uncharacterized protein n=1 Tax=Colletotrichum orchidophilum TaxID=1209926 RepID=A0A1G4BDJ0_9PEZI|nr:uncharacterized protein CORC01_05225 [Colletotrichum orchidophilum]OHE99425.1 hypothetical protein CORC01_05225 [Colletotrichum orchidophilum]
MSLLGIVHQGLALLFRNPNETREARDLGFCPQGLTSLEGRSSNVFLNAFRPVAFTRHETSIGPLRRPSICTGFTMPTFLQMAKVRDGNPVEENLATKCIESRSPEPSESDFSETSSIEMSRRSSPIPGWGSENFLDPLEELPPRPSRPLFGQRISTTIEDDLLDSSLQFQRPIGFQSEYEFGALKQNCEPRNGEDDNDSIVTAVRDGDGLLEPTPLRAPGKSHPNRARLYGASSIFTEAQSEHQRSNLITEMVGEIDEILGTFGCHNSHEVLAEDYRASDSFIASEEPMPLRIPAKKRDVHTGHPVYYSTEANPLSTIDERDNDQEEEFFHRSALPSPLHLTKNNGFLHASAVPAPLRIIKQSYIDAGHELKGQSTLRAHNNKKPAGPRSIEHARRQTSFLPDSPIEAPVLGPLFDESSFGTPLVPFVPHGSPRRLLFPSPDSISYLNHEPTQRVELDANDIATVIEAPTGPAGATEWDEEDSIDFLLDPIENAPPPVPTHAPIRPHRDPILIHGAVLTWLRNSQYTSIPQSARSHGGFDAPRPRRVRDTDASSNDEVHTPCPLRFRDVDARTGALLYPIVQPSSESAYDEDEFQNAMTAQIEARATDLDEQLRLREPVYPSRILLWPLHHPCVESEGENASSDAECSQPTPRSPTTEKRSESPYFL